MNHIEFWAYLYRISQKFSCKITSMTNIAMVAVNNVVEMFSTFADEINQLRLGAQCWQQFDWSAIYLSIIYLDQQPERVSSHVFGNPFNAFNNYEARMSCITYEQ